MKTLQLVAMSVLTVAISGCRTTSLLPPRPPSGQCHLTISWHPIGEGGDITPPAPDSKPWTITAIVTGDDAERPGTVSIDIWRGDDDRLNVPGKHQILLSGGKGRDASRAIYSATRVALQEHSVLGRPSDPKGWLYIEVVAIYDQFELRKPVGSLADEPPGFHQLIMLLNTHLPNEFAIH